MAHQPRRSSEPGAAQPVLAVLNTNTSRRSSFDLPNRNVEVLFNQHDARIIAFTAVKHTGTVMNTECSDAAPMLFSSERTIAFGRLRPFFMQSSSNLWIGRLQIYKALGSVAFLKCGAVLQPIMPRSQCWAMSQDDSKFILQIRRPTFWRIELPSSTQDEVSSAQNLPLVLDHILRYEKTACPFSRSFKTKQTFSSAELAPLTKRPWTRVDPVSPVDYSRILDSSLPPTQVLRMDTPVNAEPRPGAANLGPDQIPKTIADTATTAKSSGVEYRDASSPGGLVRVDVLLPRDPMFVEAVKDPNVTPDGGAINRSMAVIGAKTEPEPQIGSYLGLTNMEAKLRRRVTTRVASTSQTTQLDSPTSIQMTMSREARSNMREYPKGAASGNANDLFRSRESRTPWSSPPSKEMLNTDATSDQPHSNPELVVAEAATLCKLDLVSVPRKQYASRSATNSNLETRQCSSFKSRSGPYGMGGELGFEIERQTPYMNGKHSIAEKPSDSTQPEPINHGRLISRLQQSGRTLSPMPPAATISHESERETFMTHLLSRVVGLSLALMSWIFCLVSRAPKTLIHLSVSAAAKLRTSNQCRNILASGSSDQIMGVDLGCSDSEWEYDWTDAHEQVASEGADDDNGAFWGFDEHT